MKAKAYVYTRHAVNRKMKAKIQDWQTEIFNDTRAHYFYNSPLLLFLLLSPKICIVHPVAQQDKPVSRPLYPLSALCQLGATKLKHVWSLGWWSQRANLRFNANRARNKKESMQHWKLSLTSAERREHLHWTLNDCRLSWHLFLPSRLFGTHAHPRSLCLAPS